MWRLTGLALVHHALGNRVASDAAFEELRKEDPVGIAYQFAEIHAYRGEIDLAFEWLERAEATNDSGLTDAITNPLMRSLHATRVGPRSSTGSGWIDARRRRGRQIEISGDSKRTELKTGPFSFPVSE